MSSLFAAESARLETMVRFFLIAALLVSPGAFLVARRLLRSRAGTSSEPDGARDEAGPPVDRAPTDPLGDLVARIDETARAFAASGDPRPVTLELDAALARRLRPDDGGPALDRLVVDDAIRRGGLRATWERTDDGGARLLLRPAEG